MVDIAELQKAVVEHLGCNTNLKYVYMSPGEAWGWNQVGLQLGSVLVACSSYRLGHWPALCSEAVMQ